MVYRLPAMIDAPGPSRKRPNRTLVQHPPRITMLRWAFGFLIVAILAALCGFGGVAGAAADVARLVFVVFVVLFVLSFVGHLFRGRCGRATPR
jgi:uncharacterized membrane protein YtjA (UPF0391 family)